MADNGKTIGGVPSWSNDVETKFEDQPATRAEVANYVNNAFKQWHEPDHMLLLRTVKVVETLLQFLQEAGLEVPERKVDVAVPLGGTTVNVNVTIPATKVILLPTAIQKWAEQKMAEAAAAAVPKDQQS